MRGPPSTRKYPRAQKWCHKVPGPQCELPGEWIALFDLRTAPRVTCATEYFGVRHQHVDVVGQQMPLIRVYLTLAVTRQLPQHLPQLLPALHTSPSSRYFGMHRVILALRHFV